MKSLLKFSLVLAVASVTLSSCNCYKNMAKHRDELSVSCTPEVLELNNGKVTAQIKASFPADFFNSKATVRVTPVMVYGGGEVAATPFYFQGEKVDNNYTVISDNGATIEKDVEFPYNPAMSLSELQLRIEVKCKSGGCSEFTLINANTGKFPSKSEKKILESNSEEAAAIRRACGYVIADGVVALQSDFKYESLMQPMANDYKRVTTTVEKADLVYGINSSRIANKSMQNALVDQFKAIVAENEANNRITQTLYANGYASPDGPMTFNDKLSKARSESAKAAMDKLLSEYDVTIDAAAYGEDWEGFKQLVAASNIEDKNLILQVLSLYDSSAQREAEIKNMASVYGELKKDILPQLRRAQMSNKIDLQGKTDAEMMALVNANRLNELNLEELLFLSESVVEDDAVKATLLSHASSKYQDARAYNNLGVVYAAMGETEKSLAAFEKAADRGASSSEINNNLTLANLKSGKVAEAKKYSAAATAEAKNAISVAEGNYSSAAKSLKGYNAAVANVMDNDYAAAKRAIANDMSADADYLRAVIASREGDLTAAKAQLKSAVSKNASLATKAASDIAFKSLFEGGFAL